MSSAILFIPKDSAMQWIIHQIDQQYTSGKLLPTTIHWRCSHEEDEHSGTVYGTASAAGLASSPLHWARAVGPAVRHPAGRGAPGGNPASGDCAGQVGVFWILAAHRLAVMPRKRP